MATGEGGGIVSDGLIDFLFLAEFLESLVDDPFRREETALNELLHHGEHVSFHAQQKVILIRIYLQQ